MAIILVLMCGSVGFASAVAALLLFDASLFQAFGLWMSCGFAALVLALLPALLPQRQSEEDRQVERA